jgi:hypothetical protein
MHKLHRIHGPDPDIGSAVSMHARDGTGRMPRDGTRRMPSDGTEQMPRDGTGRKPRDGTLGMPRDGTVNKPRDATIRMPRDGIVRMPRDATSTPAGNRITGNFYLLVPLSRDTRIRGCTHFRRRKIIQVNWPLRPVLAELCPDLNASLSHFTPSYSSPLTPLAPLTSPLALSPCRHVATSLSHSPTPSSPRPSSLKIRISN